MLTQEFISQVNALLNRNYSQLEDLGLTSEEYKVIETVYMYHPTMDCSDCKTKIAKLYVDFGMTVMYDMLPRCYRISDILRDIEKKEHELGKLKQQLNEAKSI